VVKIGIQEDLGRATVPPEDDTDKPQKETETERQQRQRTNRSGRDDVTTEGNVTALACDGSTPTITIANRDGLVEVQLFHDAAKTCGSVKVGDYVQADGEKVNENLFLADDLSISR